MGIYFGWAFTLVMSCEPEPTLLMAILAFLSSVTEVNLELAAT